MFQDGYLLPRNRQQNQVRFSYESPQNQSSDTVHLNGNIARRKARGIDFTYWDDELPGFGLRILPSGQKTWFVMLRRRGKQKRISLGRPSQVSAQEARQLARAELAKALLDGLPAGAGEEESRNRAPLMQEYADRFWADYARNWKPSTQKRNRVAIYRDILNAFGNRRVDALRKSDIMLWRDGFAAKPGLFNRTLPVLSVMMNYAEQLGLRRRGSNPCKGTPRYKRKPMERFLNAQEFRRLSLALRDFEKKKPLAVQAIRLLIYTGARRGEIESLRWEWVQPPRIMLPDSKTDAKIIYLNDQAQAVLEAVKGDNESGLVFPAPWSGRGINLDPVWRKIRNHAALPDVRLHDLRHSFASIGIQNNVSLMVIGKLLGHALAETTARYAHLSDDVIADAATRVSGSIAKCIGIAS